MGKIDKNRIRDIVDDLREQQREEDEMYFATKTEVEGMQIKIDDTLLDVQGIIKAKEESDEYFNQKQTENTGRLDQLFQDLLDQQKQINENDVRYGKSELDLNEKMVALEKRFKAKVQD